MRHDFNQRKQRRIKSAEQSAIKAESESKRQYDQAVQMASAIPMGQPILIGHHSESRDRNYRERMHNKFGKAFDLQDKAMYYQYKAKTIASNEAIFSDDPEALDKLSLKLKELQDNQQFMKAVNQCIKRKDKTQFLTLPHATPESWEQLTNPDVMGVKGFAGYSLRNNNANINRVKQRIAQLESQQSRTAIDQTIGGVRIYENREANRLQLFFEDKPSAEVIKELKRHGFRWCRSETAWQRHNTGNALFSAKALLTKLEKGGDHGL